jgi:hypothetical protein
MILHLPFVFLILPVFLNDLFVQTIVVKCPENHHIYKLSLWSDSSSVQSVTFECTDFSKYSASVAGIGNAKPTSVCEGLISNVTTPSGVSVTIPCNNVPKTIRYFNTNFFSCGTNTFFNGLNITQVANYFSMDSYSCSPLMQFSMSCPPLEYITAITDLFDSLGNKIGMSVNCSNGFVSSVMPTTNISMISYRISCATMNPSALNLTFDTCQCSGNCATIRQPILNYNVSRTSISGPSSCQSGTYLSKLTGNFGAYWYNLANVTCQQIKRDFVILKNNPFFMTDSLYNPVAFNLSNYLDVQSVANEDLIYTFGSDAYKLCFTEAPGYCINTNSFNQSQLKNTFLVPINYPYYFSYTIDINVALTVKSSLAANPIVLNFHVTIPNEPPVHTYEQRLYALKASSAPINLLCPKDSFVRGIGYQQIGCSDNQWYSSGFQIAPNSRTFCDGPVSEFESDGYYMSGSCVKSSNAYGVLRCLSDDYIPIGFSFLVTSANETARISLICRYKYDFSAFATTSKTTSSPRKFDP